MNRILAIDGNKDNLLTLSALLQNYLPEVEIIKAGSGGEGLEKAGRENPDVILLDLRMPDMDGFEVLRRLKSLPRLSRIPVILLTATKTESSDRVKGLDIGADAFLNKPIDEMELIAQVKVALRIKKAEDLLHSEKGIMLQEIHHRVKNNMQVIVSLLNLQSLKIADLTVRQIFNDSTSRIRSMALVHEHLYRSRSLLTIDFSGYLKSLIPSLFHRAEYEKISYTIDLEQVFLNIDQAVPCGLIANELINNSLRHAFPGERQGTVHITLQKVQNNLVMLSIGDDGTGFEGDFDELKKTSLGFQIVDILARQIKGNMTIERHGGTASVLTFPLAESVPYPV
jgi:two-component sensor histidine kinase/CheY-like chemotaxis protein